MDNIYNKKYSAGYKPEFFEKTYEKSLAMISISKKDKVLDVGCGQGHFMKKLGKFSDNIFGIDTNKDAVNFSGLRNCFCMSAEKIEFEDGYFNTIFSFNTLEHITNLDKAFSEMSRVLAKNGKMVLVYPFEPFRGFFEVSSSVRVYGHPFNSRKFHLHLLNPRKIEKLGKKYNLETLKSGKMWTLKWVPFPQYFSILQKL